ncbi:MAG: hypothetical protein RIM84_16680 [Alphaproteobacteria bacterium]
MSAATPEPLNAAPEPALAHQFTVTAHLEPSVLSRVVELFVLRDLIPHDVRCRQVGNEALRIDVAVRGLAPDKAEHVAARIRQFPAVLSVLLRS